MPIIIKDQVNIYQLPKIDEINLAIKGAEFTIGDLHGNYMKLLFLLVKHGIVTNLSPENYNAFVVIYKKMTKDVTASDIAAFNRILDTLEFKAGPKIRLLGDELADRGSNDYFTLKIIDKLYKNKVDTEIIISNHGAEFIEAYETNADLEPQMLQPPHVRSLLNMNHLINKGLVSEDEVRNIIRTAYKPMLKALSYTLEDDGKSITIFSHAGIGINTICKLAEKFKVPYADGSAPNLAKTIDDINSKFSISVQSNQVHLLYEKPWMGYAYSEGRRAKLDKVPFEFLLWNRRYANVERPIEINGYQLAFSHGHDEGDKGMAPNIYNLDDNLGYGEEDEWAQGEYNVLYTYDAKAPVLDFGVLIEDIASAAPQIGSGYAAACCSYDKLSPTNRELAASSPTSGEKLRVSQASFFHIFEENEAGTQAAQGLSSPKI